MADTTKLVAQKRTEFGKGAARRTRRANLIPAVLYGHGTEPVHLSLPGHETMLAVKTANAVLEIEVEGSTQLALVKDVQREVIRRVIEHVDLVVVRRGEKVTVEVAVHVEGEAAPETVVTVENAVLNVVADATDIPESLTVSIEGLEAGSQVLASSVQLPAGVELDSDPELLVVNITQAISEEALEAELAEAEAEAGIERDEEESEDASDAAPAEGESADESASDES